MSYVDAVVIAACVRRPIRFVMDHRIFRDAGAVVHLPRDADDPDRAGEGGPGDEGARVRRGGARRSRAGEIVGIFPEGKLTETGELNPFRPGVQQIVAATPVPVVPMALSGLWGSFFSRSHRGSAMRRLRGVVFADRARRRRRRSRRDGDRAGAAAGGRPRAARRAQVTAAIRRA